MATVNYSNPNQDQTVKIFDEFYDFNLTVDANLYDAVYSYFQSVFADNSSAKNFTLTLFRISEASAIPALDLLSDIKGQDQITLTKTFAYYLNNQRSNTTLLGIGATTTPSVYAARNVLA